MNKAEYKTKCGALLNIISNRNYSTPQIYKIFYFGYYFFTILIALSVLFDKNYVVASVLSAIVFVLNGRKYEDKEWLITEYLPISFKERVRQIYLTKLHILFYILLYSFSSPPFNIEIKISSIFLLLYLSCNSTTSSFISTCPLFNTIT